VVARYAIGDIQGCMASLERLLGLVDFKPSVDRLWLVGDLVNRGPRSLDVLRWARDLGDTVTCVLGNHDLHLLAAPDCERLIDWLRTRPLLHVDAPHVVVHAGLHPRWTIADAAARAAEIERELRGPGWRAFLTQLAGPPPRWDDRLGGGDRWRAILAYLVRARTLRADGRVEPDFDGRPADAPTGCVPWFAFPNAAWATHTVMFGHWAALGLDIGPHHVGLDTGCVWGRSLTALRLDDRMVFQVKAVESAS
jgi:bis(5'-nucleosyl)-tetraphosphatase (symmetrical)